jgi:hypothetical protein
MKTKLYIVSLLLILTFYSNTFAVDVSNSSDFSQNFNNSDINTIKVQNDLILLTKGLLQFLFLDLWELKGLL